MIEYVLFNGNDPFLPRTYPTESFVDVIDKGITKRGSYADIRIYEGASQRDIINFVKQHWTFVKPSYREGTAKTIQPERDPKTNKKILELWDKIKGDREAHFTKESRIAEIVNKSGERGKDQKKRLDFSKVKMRAYRKRHAKR